MEATGVGGRGGGEDGANYQMSGMKLVVRKIRFSWRVVEYSEEAVCDLIFFLTLNGQSSSAGELELNRLNPWRNRDFFFALTLKSCVSARCKDVKSRTVGN